MTADNLYYLAQIFERASVSPMNRIDPPFACVTVNLCRETWSELAAIVRQAADQTSTVVP